VLLLFFQLHFIGLDRVLQYIQLVGQVSSGSLALIPTLCQLKLSVVDHKSDLLYVLFYLKYPLLGLCLTLKVLIDFDKERFAILYRRKGRRRCGVLSII
jgi:hypothetical protein